MEPTLHLQMEMVRHQAISINRITVLAAVARQPFEVRLLVALDQVNVFFVADCHER